MAYSYNGKYKALIKLRRWFDSTIRYFFQMVKYLWFVTYKALFIGPANQRIF